MCLATLLVWVNLLTEKFEKTCYSVFSSFSFFKKTTYCCRTRRLSVRPSVRPSFRPSVVCGNNFFSR